LEGNRELKSISKERLRQSIIEGIPSDIRGAIWCLICDFQTEQHNHDEGLYQKLLTMENSENSYMIAKDIYRTLPNTEKFNQNYEEGNNKLFNVLKAYSCYDNEVGYVQGMNYLAGLLLIEIDDEVKVFWCLLSLLFKRNWRMIFE
jgi:TBC1 domain family member 10